MSAHEKYAMHVWEMGEGRGPVIDMDNGFVAHKESGQSLDCWNLQWKIEGRDDGNGPKRPPHSMTNLPSVVPCLAEATSHQPDL